MSPLLDIDGLHVVYHTQEGILPALTDVTLRVNRGEIVGIVGETGCGKTTISAATMRLLPPNGQISSGSMVFDGRDLRACSDESLRQLRGKELAMVFQDPMTSLNPVFSIGTQMIDVQRAHPGDEQGRQAQRRRAVEMLQQVGIPDADERLDHFPHQFSGGMRQRIMIALALMSRPSLLIADEPTASLDVTLEAQILRLIRELRQAYGTAVLFISHNLGVIAQLCDRVMVMYAGRIVEEADVFSLFARPQHPYTQALLAALPSRRAHRQRLATIPGQVPGLLNLPPGCTFADRCAEARAVCQQQEPALRAVEGGKVRCHILDPDSGYDGSAPLPTAAEAPAVVLPADIPVAGRAGAPATAPAGPLVQLHGVSTHFSQRPRLLAWLRGRAPEVVRAVDDVDLAIGRGEIIGLVGESGSGKTTLARTILQLVPASGGRIVIDGEDVTTAGAAVWRQLRRRMQMVFQDPYSSLSPRLRVSYLLTEPYRIHNLPPAQQYSAGQLLRMVGLTPEQAGKFPHELSGGQARRVGIARALALRPEFILADEPTSGLDVSVAASILNLMKDLADGLGLTYFIITHDLNVVGYISHRVAVMYLGQLVETGPTAALFAAPAHPYAIALLSAIAEPDPRQRREGEGALIQGEIPSPTSPPPGCRFHTRCPFVRARCRQEAPLLAQVEPGHQVACHFWREIRDEIHG